MNRNKVLLFVIAVVGLAFLVVPNLEFLSPDNIVVRYAELPLLLTALGFILLYAVHGVVMVIPIALLYIAAGLAFPTWAGILVTYAGLTISLSIGYALGRVLGKEKVNKLIVKHKKAAGFLSGNKENVLLVCFMSRILPMPFGLVSLFFGAIKMPYPKYLLMSLLGCTPFMVPVVFAGAAITNPLSAEFLVPFIISLIVTLAIFILYKTKVVTKTNIALVLLVAQVLLLGFVLHRIFFMFPIIAGASYLVSVIIGLFLVKKDKTAAYKVMWIMIIMALPFLGGLLYLLFGNNFKTRRIANHIKEHALVAKLLEEDNIPPYEQTYKGSRTSLMRYIQQVSAYHPYENTETTYYPLGELMYEDMLVELAKAEKFIFLEYFIISQSQMWNGILEILLQKAEEGVDVRIIFDDIGSFGLLNSAYLSKLREKKIKIMRFNPIIPLLSPFMNNRNHRKIMVIDGHTGFNGGINIADEYINLDDRLGLWKDTGVRLKGDAVWSFTLMFIETWNAFSKTADEQIRDYVRHESVTTDNTYSAKKQGLVLPFGDSPLGQERLAENIYIDILNQAQRYVYIFTPYLIISEKMIYALQMAAKRGIDVRIVMPGIPDQKIVYRVSRSYYNDLLGAGVKIYEYTPGFLHAKSFVCDDEIAVVGTINLDYRSLYLHFECATLLYCTNTIEDVRNDAIKTISESREVQPEKKRFYHELIDAVLRLFAPLM